MLIVVAFIALCPLMVYRARSGPPGYRDCVRALERVTAGMPWGEVEAHLADAVAAGGVREIGRDEVPPDPPGLPAQGSPAIETEGVWLTCWRDNRHSGNPPNDGLQKQWRFFIALAMPLISSLSFAPTDYTVLLAVRRAESVASTRLLDCVWIPGPDETGWDPAFGCRYHSPGRS